MIKLQLYQYYIIFGSKYNKLSRAFLKSCQTTLTLTVSVIFTAKFAKIAKKKPKSFAFFACFAVHDFGTSIIIATLRKP